MGWNIDRFIAKESIVDEFICAICTDVVENPVQTPCQHLFCNECIRRWINEGHRTCPEDRQALTANVLKTPNRLTNQFLNKLIVRCKNFTDGCRLMSTYEDMPQLCEHERSQCQVVQNALVREVCDQFEAEANNFKKKIADLEATILDKKKIVAQLEKKILEQEKTIVNQKKIGMVIADHVVNHALIGKSIANEASKLVGLCSLTNQLDVIQKSVEDNFIASNQDTESCCDTQEGNTLIMFVRRT